jgi:hypothetical protein
VIFTDSRYATGVLAKSVDARNDSYQLSVFRQFPSSSSSFYYYTWTQRDRIDLVAAELLGDPNLWWLIMDYNPEILNPFDIPLGASLRIPGE